MSGRGTATAKRSRGRGRGGTTQRKVATPKKAETEQVEESADYFKVADNEEETPAVKEVENSEVEAETEDSAVNGDEETNLNTEEELLGESTGADDEAGDEVLDKLVEEEDLNMEGDEDDAAKTEKSDDKTDVIEIKEGNEAEVVDLCEDEKSEKKESETAEPKRKRRVFEPCLQDFSLEFTQDRYYRSLLLEPFPISNMITETVQDYLKSSDRFFWRSVAADDGNHIGHLEIRLKSRDTRDKILEEVPKLFEGTKVHTMKNSNNFKEYKTLGVKDDGFPLSHTCVISVYDLPHEVKHSQLTEMFPEPTRIMMGPPRSSPHDAGYAYLLFPNKEKTKEALTEYQKEEKKIDDHLIKITALPLARPRPVPKGGDFNKDKRGKTDSRYDRDRRSRRSSPPRKRGGTFRGDRSMNRRGDHRSVRNDRRDDRRDYGRGMGSQMGIRQDPYPVPSLLGTPNLPAPLMGLNPVGAANPVQSNSTEAVNLLVGLSSVLGAIQKQQPQSDPYKRRIDDRQHSSMGEYEEGGYSYEGTRDDRRGSGGYFQQSKRNRMDDYY